MHLFNGITYKSHANNSKKVFNNVTEAVIKMTRLPFLLLTLALLQVEAAPKHLKDFLEKEGILPVIFLAVYLFAWNIFLNHLSSETVIGKTSTSELLFQPSFRLH